MSEALKVTSPEEYAEKAKAARAKDDAGFLHKLKETGAVVRLRHIDLEAQMVMGEIPISLVAAAVGKGEALGTAERELTQEDVEVGNRRLIVIRQTVVENCLEPSLRYSEGVGVYFVNGKGEQVAKVHKSDFMEMFAVITGQEGADGLDSFRNRKERRASAAQSRRKTLRGKAESAAEGKPALA